MLSVLETGAFKFKLKAHQAIASTRHGTQPVLTALSAVASDELTARRGISSRVVEGPREQFAQLELSEQVGSKEQRQPLLSHPLEHLVLLGVIQIQPASIVASALVILDVDPFGQTIGFHYGVRRRVDLLKQTQIPVVLNFLRKGLEKVKI